MAPSPMRITRVLEKGILFFQDLQKYLTKWKCTFNHKNCPSSDFSSILRFLIPFSSELRNCVQSICIGGQFRTVAWDLRTVFRQRTIPQSITSYLLKQNKVSKYRTINSFQLVKILRVQKRRLDDFPCWSTFEGDKGSYIKWNWGWDSRQLTSYT